MAKEKNMVDVFVPRETGDTDPNLVIGINGKLWLLPKGKTSTVPDFVAYEYKRSLGAARFSQEHAERMIDENRDKEKLSEQAAV